jgi:hypothetical protein
MTYSSVPVPGLSVVFLLLPWPSGRSSFRHGIARGVRLPDGAPRQGESDALEVNPFFSAPNRTPPGRDSLRPGPEGGKQRTKLRTRGEHLLGT